MTDSSKATPRPWRAFEFASVTTGTVVVNGDDDVTIGRIFDAANAALIIEVVNAYDNNKAQIAELEARIAELEWQGERHLTRTPE